MPTQKYNKIAYQTILIKKGGRAYVNIAEHTNTYHTKFYFNINYFINALLQNRLHSNFR